MDLFRCKLNKRSLIFIWNLYDTKVDPSIFFLFSFFSLLKNSLPVFIYTLINIMNKFAVLMLVAMVGV